MASPERINQSSSVRDVAISWLNLLHIKRFSPPPSVETIFLETGIAPEESGIVIKRPVYELDMKQPPSNDQLYLWHGEGGDLQEVDIFVPFAKEEGSPVPAQERREKPVRQPSTSENLVLKLEF